MTVRDKPMRDRLSRSVTHISPLYPELDAEPVSRGVTQILSFYLDLLTMVVVNPSTSSATEPEKEKRMGRSHSKKRRKEKLRERLRLLARDGQPKKRKDDDQ